MTAKITTFDVPLTALHRCDRCGAQAYLAAKIADSELLFCNHHANEHYDKLLEVATEIHDERGLLQKQEAGPRDAASAVK